VQALLALAGKAWTPDPGFYAIPGFWIAANSSYALPVTFTVIHINFSPNKELIIMFEQAF